MIVYGSSFSQGRIYVVGNVGQLFALVCTLEEEPAEATHAWSSHNQGGDAVQLASGMLGYIDHIGMVLKVVGESMATTV